MSTMLNFKHGLFANLPQTKSAGTIYVTTDEKAMYVDLPNADNVVERIRLSQIITLSTYDWQNLTPPYSTEAFYYVSDANALLKYNGTQWVQLNSTADLETAISTLNTKLYGADGQSGDVGTLKNDVANLKEKDTELAGDIANLVKEDTRLSERIEEVALAAGDVTALNALAGRVTALDGGDTPASGRVTILEADMANVKSALNDDNGNLLNVSAIKATADQAKNTADTAVQSDTFNTFKTENTAAIGTAKQEAIDAAASALNTYKGTNDTAIAGLDSRIDVLETAGYVKKDGSVAMEANLNIGSHKIINVAAPEAESDAANKGYVDAQDKKIAGTNEDGSLYVAQTVKSAYKKAADAADAAKAAQDAADGKVDASYVTNALAPYAKSTDVSAEIDADVLAAKNAILGEENSTKTVAGAYAEAASALAKANEKTTMAEVEGKGYAVATEVEATYAKKADVSKEIDDDIAAAKTAILGAENYEHTVREAYEKAEEALANTKTKVTLEQVKSEIDSRNYTTMAAVESKGYATTSQAQGYANAVLGTSSDAAGTATVHGALKQATDNTNDISTMKSGATITTFKGLEDVINALDTKVTTNMQAADAMTFKGTVNCAISTGAEDEKALPTENVNKGDTYKVTADFLMDGTPIFIGDLLIATGDEDENGVITNPTWEHVPSGYRADYVPAFSLTNAIDSDDEDTFDDDRKVTLNLTSAHAETGIVGDLGAIDFMVDENSALTISATNTTEKKASLTIGMAWNTF